MLKDLWQKYRDHRRAKAARLKAKAAERGPVKHSIISIVSIIFWVFVIRTVAVEAYRIPSGSMEKTLLIGDFLLVNKFIYGIRTPDWIGIPFTDIGIDLPYGRTPGFEDPERGDIIVFKNPRDTKINYIKRCIAIPGDTLEILDKQVFINGVRFADPPESQFIMPMVMPQGYNDPRIFPNGQGNKDNFGPLVIPEDSYFMMGDNRDNSEDSRFWGFLDRDLILGKAWIIYFSWNRRYSPWLLHKKIRWNRIGHLIR